MTAGVQGVRGDGSGLRGGRERAGAGRRSAQAAGLAAAAGADVEGVLVGEDLDVVEDVAIAFEVERLGLRAGGDLFVGAVEVVLEGEVEGVEVVAEDVDGGVAGLGAARALAGVVDEDGGGGVRAGAFEGDVGLVDDDLLAVGAGRDEDGAAGGRKVVDGGLHGGVVGFAVGGNMQGGELLGGCGDGEEDEGERRERTQGEALGVGHVGQQLSSPNA